jgi:hypothetical protein
MNLKTITWEGEGRIDLAGDMGKWLVLVKTTVFLRVP